MKLAAILFLFCFSGFIFAQNDPLPGQTQDIKDKTKPIGAITKSPTKPNKAMKALAKETKKSKASGATDAKKKAVVPPPAAESK